MTELMSAFLLISVLAGGAQAPAPIDSVAINANRAFVVNGAPFFPIMIWLQDPQNFPKATEAGINTIAGYWPGSGGTSSWASPTLPRPTPASRAWSASRS